MYLLFNYARKPLKSGSLIIGPVQWNDIDIDKPQSRIIICVCYYGRRIYLNFLSASHLFWNSRIFVKFPFGLDSPVRRSLIFTFPFNIFHSLFLSLQFQNWRFSLPTKRIFVLCTALIPFIRWCTNQLIRTELASPFLIQLHFSFYWISRL